MSLFIRGNTANLSDAELISRYRESGDNFFVGELFKRYSHLVFGVCLQYFRDKEESKDAVMRIFEKLFEALRKNEVQHFPAWLGFVSRNFCISELRKQKSHSAKEEEHAYELGTERFEDPRISAEAEAERERHSGNLNEALQELKQEQRTCLELFYIREKSYKDIIEITGFSDKEVKSFIQNGKRNLKILLSTRNHEIIPSY
jgi:RNA polymerase sigma factor (sigma-70 family)